jgi:decaprenylphospho-beta-D-erythro-pentofuranosid-2-ulose 2-reductase
VSAPNSNVRAGCMGRLLILGATSSIARAVAQEFASHGYNLVLGGRDGSELNALASDISIRSGVNATPLLLDVLDLESHKDALQSCFRVQGEGLDGLIVCVGYLGDQGVAQADFAEARRVIETNLTGCISVLNLVANEFETRRSGFICALGSVAGDRGRQSNYLYGAAKGALAIYLEGLRNRLFRSNVRVVTVKPGFVDTAMTFGKPGLFLVASPERVGRAVYRAIKCGKDTTYVPWFWRPIMLLIRLLPESVFKRMRF